MIVNSERKLIEANKRLALAQQSNDKRAAAEYLVEQIRVNQEERSTLIKDNQTMALQVQDLSLEVEKLRDELQLFNLVKESNTDD